MAHYLLNKHGTHREQVINFFQSPFKWVTLKWIKNELTKNNVSVLSLTIFNENRNTLMYKVIGSVFLLSLINIFVLIIWFWSKKSDPKTKITSKRPISNFLWVGNTWDFDEYHVISWIFKSSISIVILTLRNTLAPYYLSKGFFIIETELVGVDNIPITVKNQCY